eukprot:2159177-Pyramimonas_sp.AAC.1
MEFALWSKRGPSIEPTNKTNNVLSPTEYRIPTGTLDRRKRKHLEFVILHRSVLEAAWDAIWKAFWRNARFFSKLLIQCRKRLEQLDYVSGALLHGA